MAFRDVNRSIAFMLLSLLVLSCTRAWSEPAQDLKDVAIASRLDTAFVFTRSLNPFDVDVRVERGVVYLSGSVETTFEREFAAELAKHVKDVVSVENDLKVMPAASLSAEQRAAREARAKERDEFRAVLNDASTTAMARSKLLANSNTKDLDIDVEAKDQVVILRGLVRSPEERSLAELLVRDMERVATVKNELQVNPQMVSK